MIFRLTILILARNYAASPPSYTSGPTPRQTLAPSTRKTREPPYPPGMRPGTPRGPTRGTIRAGNPVTCRAEACRASRMKILDRQFDLRIATLQVQKQFPCENMLVVTKCHTRCRFCYAILILSAGSIQIYG